VKNTIKYILKSLAKLLGIFFTVLTFVILIIALVKPEWMKIAIEWIGELIQRLGEWNYLVAFASACIESLPLIGTAVPGMNVMILVWGFWGWAHITLTIISAVLWAMLGNYIGYWIGKWWGKELIAKYGDWIGIGRTEARILEWQIEKNGFWYIVLGKFHNLTRSVVPFIAGGSGMAERNFWIYNMIGSIIWATSIIVLGVNFIGSYETILDNLGKIMIGVLVWVAGYIYFFRRASFGEYLRSKEAEITEKQAQKSKKASL
jgi:membrane-associated protein